MSKVWKFWEAFKLKIPRWFRPPWPLQLRGGHPTTPLELPSHFIEAKTHRARTTWENLEKPGRPTIFQLQPLGFLRLVGWLVGWFCKTQLLRLDSILEEIHLGELQNLKHFLGGESRTKISADGGMAWMVGQVSVASRCLMFFSHYTHYILTQAHATERQNAHWQKPDKKQVCQGSYSYCMIHPACVSQHEKTVWSQQTGPGPQGSSSDFLGSNHHQNDLVAPIKPFLVKLSRIANPQKKTKHPNAQQNIV